MVGLIIGRGGEQINKIQQDSGCKVQIAHDSAGLPDRTVSLTGSPDESQGPIDDIVEMIIPAGKAGLIIGKGGETIKQLQERAGVKMILIQDGSQPPNIDKPLRIIGDPTKCRYSSQAKDMVNEILRDRDHAGFAERSEYGPRMGGGGGGIDVTVPRHSVGVVIGRSGEMIKKIQSDAGVKIQFKPDDGTGPEKIAHIMGPPDQCQHAASIITDLLQSIPCLLQGRGQGNWGPPGGEMTFSIPAHKCGLVIGRGGENVKSINQQTGAFVEISRQPPPNGDPNFKMFIIRGSPQQIDHAKQLIEEKIEVCSNHSRSREGICPLLCSGASPGGPQYCPQGWGGNYQQWQAPGPQDPSKSLLLPKRSMGCILCSYYGQQPGGAMAAQAPGASAPGSGDQGQAPQASGGQPDYTKAWEEYYKKMGMGKTTVLPGPEYYRQQAAYYGQPGQAPGQAAPPQQGQQVAHQ
uniref:KH-type splicing regulatory protein n=1 Tax=Cyclopterus lumpus TaxID=8103 RepID=A0A8C2ZI74_CYCLU